MGKLAVICAALSFIFIQFAHGALLVEEHTHLNFETIDHDHHKLHKNYTSEAQHKSSHDYHNLVHDNYNIVFSNGYLASVITSLEGKQLLAIFDGHLGLSLSPPVPPPLS